MLVYRARPWPRDSTVGSEATSGLRSYLVRGIQHALLTKRIIKTKAKLSCLQQVH